MRLTVLYPFLLLLAYFSKHKCSTSVAHDVTSAHLVSRSELPLRTSGRYIVNQAGERVKWACVNWYGAHLEPGVAGGLEVRTLDEIAALIVELGFNCVRLPYSTQHQLENPLVEKRFVQANPQLIGKRFLEVWDATVSALTDAGLMVIINNHLHHTGWCCLYSQNEGLWYLPGYPESVWIDSLVNMTLRHRHSPLVVAIDLRNEVHDYANVSLSWGDGNPHTDWAAAAGRAGDAVLAVNPSVLIVVEGMCFSAHLPAWQQALELSVPDRVVYGVHDYLEYHIINTVFELIGGPGVGVAASIKGLALGIAVLILWTASWFFFALPCPTSRTLLVSAGVWILCLGVLYAALCHIWHWFVRYKAPACGWYDRTRIHGYVYVALSAAVLLAAVLVGLGARRPPDGLVADEGSEGSDPEGMPAPDDVFVEACSEGSESDAEMSRDGNNMPRAMPSLLCEGCRIRSKDAVPVSSHWLTCCGLQCGICCLVWCFWMLALYMLASSVTTYAFQIQSYESRFGYALQADHVYTGPVWMCEFGTGKTDYFWKNQVRYLAEKDMDFAYWAINGRKWSTGQVDFLSGTIKEDGTAHWVYENYGLLKDNYRNISQAQVLRDIQSLMLASNV